MSRHGKNVLKAIGVIMVFLIIALLLDRCDVANDKSASSGGIDSGKVKEALLREAITGSDKELDTYLDSVTASYKKDVPQAFSAEALDLIDEKQVLVSEDERLIGFSSDLDSTSQFQRTREALEKKGWIYIDSGLSNAASFAKDKGELRWLFLQCIDVGAGSQVVFSLGGEQ